MRLIGRRTVVRSNLQPALSAESSLPYPLPVATPLAAIANGLQRSRNDGDFHFSALLLNP